MNIDPLKIESFKGYTVVKSEITGAYVKLAEPKAISTNLAFTAMFSEMLDVLLLGLSINIPVIFEGMPGQGKQTAINYVAQILGYNVINIIISQSTKVDDLLGKITIERDKSNNLRVFFIKTKLVNALESDKESDKSEPLSNIASSLTNKLVNPESKEENKNDDDKDKKKTSYLKKYPQIKKHSFIKFEKKDCDIVQKHFFYFIFIK